MTSNNEFKTISALLAERTESVVRDLLPHGERKGDQWLALCPWRLDRRIGSFMVTLSGQYAGRWKDWATGESGDLLDLIAKVRGITLVEASRWARVRLGISTKAAAHPCATASPKLHLLPQNMRKHEATRRDWSLELARRLWFEALPLAGTLAHQYLAARHLLPPKDAPVRFHPKAWRNRDCGPAGPAMIALMTDPEDGTAGIGVHVTYLHRDGQGKADGDRPKIMLGGRGVIRLTPDEDVAASLGIAEGIETALAVMHRTGWKPIWAASCAAGISNFPVLPGLEMLTVFADQDRAGLEAARRCCRRWAEEGREARVVLPPYGDWDEALTGPLRTA
jgi:putative DNA primase/helicase